MLCVRLERLTMLAVDDVFKMHIGVINKRTQENDQYAGRNLGPFLQNLA